MEARHGDWIATFTGRQFWPCDPRADEVDILDIAHALSLICRFTGHCREFYSVAQHSVLCSRIVPERDAKWGLLHDASEAYLADIARPVKPFLANYVNLEEQLMRVIAIRFGLEVPIPDSVGTADDILVCSERDSLMPPGPDWGAWTHGIPRLPEPIRPMASDLAEQMFLAEFKMLFEEDK